MSLLSGMEMTESKDRRGRCQINFTGRNLKKCKTWINQVKKFCNESLDINAVNRVIHKNINKGRFSWVVVS